MEPPYCIVSAPPCRESSQRLPRSHPRQSVLLLQKLPQRSTGSEPLRFRTARARVRAILHPRSAARATRWGGCGTRALAAGGSGQSCTRGRGLWSHSSPVAPDSWDPRDGRTPRGAHQYLPRHTGATAVAQGARAARPRLTLPAVGHRQQQGTRAAPFTGILFTCCSPFFGRVCACVCEIVSNVTLHYQGYNESLLKWI